MEPTDGTILTGTAEAGSTVDVDINGDGTPDYTVEADADGNWSVTPDAPLADGTEVSVTATDPAGNTSDPATTIVDENLNDTTPPAAPTIAEVMDDVAPGTDPATKPPWEACLQANGATPEAGIRQQAGLPRSVPRRHCGKLACKRMEQHRRPAFASKLVSHGLSHEAFVGSLLASEWSNAGGRHSPASWSPTV
ncbi:Ig-like domain-containing protein [Alcanivorax sp. 24]|uniref:Ig-like domain-containing protein n=1 Tax=Alcanivorax sp. 24 TaxID=2545266 RepID=UPI00105E3967|nr:Ig-like domain-containing protein [Alcanivorax sp. 24]